MADKESQRLLVDGLQVEGSAALCCMTRFWPVTGSPLLFGPRGRMLHTLVGGTRGCPGILTVNSTDSVDKNS